MTGKLHLIYRKLYNYFGPQHWWPGKTPFEVMVGAILTQNTSWLNVEKAINNLKKYKLLEPPKLYNLPNKRVASLIRSAGYYNLKAKRLKEFLTFFLRHYRGDARKMAALDTQKLRRQLLEVNGIGQETADSILLYALGKPVFVIDAYTKRFLLRHGLIKEETTYLEAQGLFMQNLRAGVKLFNEYHALLVRLGKEYCLKDKPRCQSCPLKGL